MHDPRDGILLPGDARLGPLRLLGEFGQGATDFGALAVQVAQLAVGLADRAFRFAQLVGGLGARFLRTDEVLLERLQPLAQRFEFLLGGREGELAREERREQRDRDRARRLVQPFALPWAATAWAFASIAAASPR
ncbi:MAG: hypothetical protein K2Y35_11085 [Burkholderiales bacterium]|nr:hypothetical protein [Burkholderiales bacterium]